MKKYFIIFVLIGLLISCSWRMDTNQISKQHQVDVDAVIVYLEDQLVKDNIKCDEEDNMFCISSVKYIAESKTVIYDFTQEYINRKGNEFISEFVHITAKRLKEDFEQFWVFDEDSEFKYLIINIEGKKIREYRLN